MKAEATLFASLNGRCPVAVIEQCLFGGDGDGTDAKLRTAADWRTEVRATVDNMLWQKRNASKLLKNV